MRFVRLQALLPAAALAALVAAGLVIHGLEYQDLRGIPITIMAFVVGMAAGALVVDSAVRDLRQRTEEELNTLLDDVDDPPPPSPIDCPHWR